jgi:hypothetical protein
MFRRSFSFLEVEVLEVTQRSLFCCYLGMRVGVYTRLLKFTIGLNRVL